MRETITKLHLQYIIICLLFLQLFFEMHSQETAYPLIGAQVFIEPGQTANEVETWFKALDEHNMEVCRIRIFEQHIRNTDGTWDFTLYDRAFNFAEKYNIRIFATLFPAAPGRLGGFKFPYSKEHEAEVAEYIKAIVSHYAKHPALYTWVLINEIGRSKLPLDKEYTAQRFEDWKEKHPVSTVKNEYGKEYYHEDDFFRDHNTYYLSWLAKQVREYDKKNYLHVNTHGVHSLLPQYDFKAWEEILTSHGASMHPSWHFGEFKRDEYTLAVSLTNDLVRDGSQKLPYWVTELQGGNNTYSGVFPFCPTKEEIAQWLCTSICSGAEGVIFWTLNPRAFGFEAGEWGMLDYLNNPSDRLVMAGKVAATIKENENIFLGTTPIEPDIFLMYTNESFQIEKRMAKFPSSYEAHKQGAVIQSVIEYYQALSERGVQSKICDLDNFTTNLPDYSNKIMIVAHQIAITKKQWKTIEDFVKKGGKLILSGLSGYYNQYAQVVFKTKEYPIEMLGAQLAEFKVVADTFSVKLNKQNITLTGSYQQGYLHVDKAVEIATQSNRTVGIRNIYGKGEVIWLPTQIAMGARLTDNESLSEWLYIECEKSIRNSPVSFSHQYKDVLIKTLENNKSYITSIVNNSDKPCELVLNRKNVKFTKTLFSIDEGTKYDQGTLSISANGVWMAEWRKKD